MHACTRTHTVSYASSEQVFARLKFIRIRDSIYDPTNPLLFQDMKAFPGYSTSIDLFHVPLFVFLARVQACGTLE
jgi:hypothetical protein